MQSRILILVFLLALPGCSVRQERADRNYLRGNRFLREGLPQMAIQFYRRVVEDDAGRPEVWFNLGMAQLPAQRPVEAAVSFRRSLTLKSSARVWYNLGVAEIRANNPGQAVAALRRSIALAPTKPAAWNNLGISYRRLRRYRLAEEAFLKALTLGGEDASTLNNLAWLYLVWKDAGPDRGDKALSLAKRAETRNRGKDARILATLAEAHFQNDERKAAVKAIKRALLLEPRNRYYRNLLAKYREGLNSN